MSVVVPLIEAVTRRELLGHRTISLGVVTEVFTNGAGDGANHLDAHVRLQGGDLELQHVPVAVSRPGLSVVPPVDSLVVVGFLDGDVNGAVILGVIHDADTPSPQASADEVVYEVPDPGGDARRLELKLPNGNTLTVTDDKVEVSMGGSSLVVESGGNVTIEAKGDVSLKASGKLSLEGSAGASLKGPTVDVEASGAAKLKGATTTVAGNVSFSPG